MRWIIPPVSGLIETAAVPEFFVDGIGAIELTNGNIRLYLFSDQLPLDSRDTTRTHVVALKLVGPLSNVPQCIGQLASCLWRDGLGIQERIGPHLVR